MADNSRLYGRATSEGKHLQLADKCHEIWRDRLVKRVNTGLRALSRSVHEAKLSKAADEKIQSASGLEKFKVPKWMRQRMDHWKEYLRCGEKIRVARVAARDPAVNRITGPFPDTGAVHAGHL